MHTKRLTVGLLRTSHWNGAAFGQMIALCNVKYKDGKRGEGGTKTHTRLCAFVNDQIEQVLHTDLTIMSYFTDFTEKILGTYS